MREAVFLGPLGYWLGLLLIAAFLYFAGTNGLHVRHFLWFLLGLGACVTAVVVGIVWSYREGARVTRERLPERGEDI